MIFNVSSRGARGVLATFCFALLALPSCDSSGSSAVAAVAAEPLPIAPVPADIVFTAQPAITPFTMEMKSDFGSIIIMTGSSKTSGLMSVVMYSKNLGDLPYRYSKVGSVSSLEIQLTPLTNQEGVNELNRALATSSALREELEKSKKPDGSYIFITSSSIAVVSLLKTTLPGMDFQEVASTGTEYSAYWNKRITVASGSGDLRILGWRLAYNGEAFSLATATVINSPGTATFVE